MCVYIYIYIYICIYTYIHTYITFGRADLPGPLATYEGDRMTPRVNAAHMLRGRCMHIRLRITHLSCSNTLDAVLPVAVNKTILFT